MPKQPESKLVRDVRKVFEDVGGRAFKIHGSDEGVQEIGIPDLLICLWGEFIGLEVKQPGAKLRPRQKLVLHEIFKAGGVAAVVETVGQAEILLEFLNRRRHNDPEGIVYYRSCFTRKWPAGMR